MNLAKYKKLIIVVLVLVSVVLTYLFTSNSSNQPNGQNVISKVLKIEPTFLSELKDDEVVNILLIGKDIGKERRAKGQTGYKLIF